MVFVTRVTCPAPPQVLQVLYLVSEELVSLFNLIFLETPFAISSRESLTLILRFEPFTLLLRPPPPPPNPPKPPR